MAGNFTLYSPTRRTWRMRLLSRLAGGEMWMFVVTRVQPDADLAALNVTIEIGGGLANARAARNLLQKTLDVLDVLPEEI